MKLFDQPGMEPIRSLLEDPEITEIMINGPNQVYVERDGAMELHPTRLRDVDQLAFLIETMINPTQREVNTSQPYVDFSLPDGSRVNVILPPLSLIGPVVTIRKFTKSIRRVDDLIRRGTLDDRMAELLLAAIRGQLNIVFSGSTGSGKTTTLNVLSSYIPSSERIVTIEDTAELMLEQDHVVRLETRLPNAEGRGEVTIGDMFRNSLRMRPDRIIVGEVRSAEAVDMLQAIASGHEGSLVVLHAASPVEVISRLEVMILSAGLQLPLWAVHRQISAALDLIVQQEQLPDGTRKIVDIAEVGDVIEGTVEVRNLFTYDRSADAWRCTGVRPSFLDKLAHRQVTLREEIFAPDESAGAERG